MSRSNCYIILLHTMEGRREISSSITEQLGITQAQEIDPKKQRLAELAFELISKGVDLKRLMFHRWLIENKRDPEWIISKKTKVKSP